MYMSEVQYQITDPESVMELRGRLFRAYLDSKNTGFSALPMGTSEEVRPRQFTIRVDTIYLESPSAFLVTDTDSGEEIFIKMPRHGPVEFKIGA